MNQHVVLDARNLEPPEPLARVLDSIARFQPGDTLKLLIDHEPRLLYPILDRSGFGHHTEPGAASVYEILIWQLAA